MSLTYRQQIKITPFGRKKKEKEKETKNQVYTTNARFGNTRLCAIA